MGDACAYPAASLLATTMDIQAAIRLRHSTRRYADRTVPPATLEGLLAGAASVEQPARTGVRVTLVSGQRRVASILARYAGVYGLVQGAPHLLVGVLSQDTDLARLDLGYVLEHVVLEATRLGVATCWMTGSYDPRQAARIAGTGPGERVGAAIAVGYPKEDPLARLHDHTVRRLVAGQHRKPLAELVFAGRWGQRWSPQQVDPFLVEALECARLAPSARNRQPWRFVVGEQLHLALVEPAPVDGGIVMAHVALVARTTRGTGRWSVRWGDCALAAALNLPATAIPVGSFLWAGEKPGGS